MLRKNPISAIVTNDFGGGELTPSEWTKSIFIASMSNKDLSANPKFSEMSLSKFPLGLPRAILSSLAVGTAATIDYYGPNNELARQTTKGIIAAPISVAALVTTPVAKLDEAAIAVTKEIGRAIDNYMQEQKAAKASKTKIISKDIPEIKSKKIENNNSESDDFVVDLKNAETVAKLFNKEKEGREIAEQRSQKFSQPDKFKISSTSPTASNLPKNTEPTSEETITTPRTPTPRTK